MTKDEQFAFACDNILPNINTWEDIYTFFGEVMERVTQTMHPALVFDALFTMYAFMLAMKELPSEGDIKVLATKMLHILIHESEEKMGASITVLSATEAAESVQKAAENLFSSLLLHEDDGAPKIVH